MITELDLEAAQLAVEEAQRGIVEAENFSPARADVGALYAFAQGRLRHAILTQERLVAQHDGERAAAEAFTATEKSSAKRLAAMDKESTASRTKLQAAFTAAQEALVALVDAVDDRNATLGRHAEELADLGLVLPVGGEGEHENGVTVRCDVKLRGGWWKHLDAGLVVNLVAERVKVARCPDRVGLRLTIRRLAKATRLFERHDVDLEAVPLPDEKASKQLPRIQFPPVTGAPVGITERERAKAMERNKMQWVGSNDKPGMYDGESF